MIWDFIFAESFFEISKRALLVLFETDRVGGEPGIEKNGNCFSARQTESLRRRRQTPLQTDSLAEPEPEGRRRTFTR